MANDSSQTFCIDSNIPLGQCTTLLSYAQVVRLTCTCGEVTAINCKCKYRVFLNSDNSSLCWYIAQYAINRSNSYCSEVVATCSACTHSQGVACIDNQHLLASLQLRSIHCTVIEDCLNGQCALCHLTTIYGSSGDSSLTCLNCLYQTVLINDSNSRVRCAPYYVCNSSVRWSNSSGQLEFLASLHGSSSLIKSNALYSYFLIYLEESSTLTRSKHIQIVCIIIDLLLSCKVSIRTITNTLSIDDIVNSIAILIRSKLTSSHITNMEGSSMGIFLNECRICQHFCTTNYHACATNICWVIISGINSSNDTVLHMLHASTTCSCNCLCFCRINHLRLSLTCSNLTSNFLNFHQLTVSNLYQLNLCCACWIESHQTTFCREDIAKGSNLVSTACLWQLNLNDSRFFLTLLDDTNTIHIVREVGTKHNITCIIQSNSCTQSISSRYRSCYRVNFVDGSIRVNHYCIIGICPLVVCSNHISSVQSDSCLKILTILGKYANSLSGLIGNIEYTIITHTYAAVVIRVCSFIVNCNFPQFLNLYISIDWLWNGYLTGCSIATIYGSNSDSSRTYSIRLDYTQ